MVQVSQSAGKVVDEKGAAIAADLFAWSKHEVIDNELFAACEKVGEADVAGFVADRREGVGLRDFNHGEGAHFLSELHVRAQSCFLLDEEFFAGLEPFRVGDDLISDIGISYVISHCD